MDLKWDNEHSDARWLRRLEAHEEQLGRNRSWRQEVAAWWKCTVTSGPRGNSWRTVTKVRFHILPPKLISWSTVTLRILLLQLQVKVQSKKLPPGLKEVFCLLYLFTIPSSCFHFHFQYGTYHIVPGYCWGNIPWPDWPPRYKTDWGRHTSEP